MENEAAEERGISVWLTIGFVALALLLGPVASYVADPFAAAVQWQVLAGGAVASAIAGCGLLVAGAAAWWALTGRAADSQRWVLLAAAVAFGTDVRAGLERRVGLQGTGWGVVLLIAVAAPLWLGLLSALRMIAGEVPRVVVGGGHCWGWSCAAGDSDGRVCDCFGAGADVGGADFVGMLTVYAWWFARERLAWR